MNNQIEKLEKQIKMKQSLVSEMINNFFKNYGSSSYPCNFQFSSSNELENNFHNVLNRTIEKNIEKYVEEILNDKFKSDNHNSKSNNNNSKSDPEAMDKIIYLEKIRQMSIEERKIKTYHNNLNEIKKQIDEEKKHGNEILNKIVYKDVSNTVSKYV